MLLNKKADMSIALIVAAVIALIVLVVALAIFGKGTGEAAKTLSDCKSRGGECLLSVKCPNDQAQIPNVKCDIGWICCLKV
ncbi:MAG: hypothetical protein AABX34_07530 [Nanoarchaeota archaeon]